MQSDPPSKQSIRPPLYKEIMVGLLVGGMLGPLVGWFIGTFVTFFAISAMDTSQVRGARSSAFVGGLIGIPLGLATGLAVGLPLRILSSRVFSFLKNPWFGALAGAVLGWMCGYVIPRNWYPSFGALIYVVIHSMLVGGIVGVVTVLAKPKWL